MSHIILSTKKVIAKTTISRTTLHRKVKEGTFPAPITLGAHSVGWVESEVDAWIEALMKSRAANSDGESVGENQFQKRENAA
ncbi:AlpA family transcriptional regulator [Herbaspirillum sp. RV1423]|uniref:helix-turn-helix transcriptional regulator n=1 Tax=Herbaspirillum sp. RV1423 TaxID=1443993 RepID=UPI0004B704E7|nr:AlpA family transcriptional regulator [Herbaspirillum sp. RV1423]